MLLFASSSTELVGFHTCMLGLHDGIASRAIHLQQLCMSHGVSDSADKLVLHKQFACCRCPAHLACASHVSQLWHVQLTGAFNASCCFCNCLAVTSSPAVCKLFGGHSTLCAVCIGVLGSYAVRVLGLDAPLSCYPASNVQIVWCMCNTPLAAKGPPCMHQV